VICDAKVAVRALKWAVGEMENRYQLLARAGARDIESYNQKVRETGSGGEEEPRALPYVVIIVDELADLMLSMPNEIETNIARLAQMARAVGIHMVLATQRPSVDVITGVIKANFPCRMAFRVPSKTDSRTILDQNGAETLLGRGDMLFLASGKRDVMRVHAAYISLEEVERLVEHVKRQPMRPAEPFVDFSRTEAAGGGPRGRDELFDEAAHLVVKHQQGSVSLLQRRLTIGYARAARLIDMLEEAGVVGPFEGSKAREVLIRSEEDLDFIRDSSR
jgi:S-DNA-T family DNA segregation ATPase FtsK/SpoIIIE